MKRYYNKHPQAFKGKVLISLMSMTLLLNFENPAFAASAMDCSGMNHPAYQNEYRSCIRAEIAISATDAGVDCIDCLFSQTEKSNPWVEALGMVAQPLAFVGATYLGAKYAHKSQAAWAGAYETGQRECTNRFNSYLDYSVSTGANPVNTTDASGLSTCNGMGMGGYAGYGGYSGNGYGGYGNPFQSAGYSSGYLGGMMGPYYGGATGGINGQFGVGLGGSLGGALGGMMGYGNGMGIGGGINIGGGIGGGGGGG